MTQEPYAPQSMVEPALGEAAAFVERTLDTLLPRPAGPEAMLLEAMRRAALGGERLRGFFVLQSGRLFGVDRRALGRVAAAVECVHACSRIHEGERGTDAHSTPGEEPGPEEGSGGTMAALAGNALLTLAFGLLAAPDSIGDPFTRAELVARLAQASGHGGLVGGQMLDAAFDAAAEAPPLPEISRLQRMKTAALITFSCEAGALLGRASPPARHALSAYGQDVGMAAQIASDLAAAGDAARGMRKTSVVFALGPERARAQAEALAAQAVRHLDLFDEKADLLRAAAEYIVASRM